MSVLFYSLGLFLIAFFIHLILWRIYLPRNHTRALTIIFSVTLLIGIFILLKFSDYRIAIFGIALPHAITDYLQLSLAFVSYALFYIVTYGAIEVDSPSLIIVLKIADSGDKGLEMNTLIEDLKEDYLITNRVKELLMGGFVSLTGQTYELKKRGRLLVSLFIVYRKLLGAEKGG